MVRLSANLSWLFKEVPFAQRFQRAAACNFKACEFLFDQYEHTNAAVAEMCATSGLTPVLLNAPAGDWASGERGFGGLPDREDEFRRSVHTALECASAISCPTIHVMAGMATGGQDEGEATFARRLRWASEEAQSAGVRVCIEPLNAKDAPGYLLPDTAAALRVLDAADHPNCHLQLDLYHFYLTESKNLEGRVFPPIPDPTPRASEGPAALRPRLRELLPRTAHVQLANPLGRHEPRHWGHGEGDVDFGPIISLIDRQGYTGFIGLECVALATRISEYISWLMNAMLRAARAARKSTRSLREPLPSTHLSRHRYEPSTSRTEESLGWAKEYGITPPTSTSTPTPLHDLDGRHGV